MIKDKVQSTVDQKNRMVDGQTKHFILVVYANAARRDAGFFNVFLLRSYFLWVVWVGGWGDVNVPWKRYVTYAGVGVGGVGWC